MKEDGSGFHSMYNFSLAFDRRLAAWLLSIEGLALTNIRIVHSLQIIFITTHMVAFFTCPPFCTIIILKGGRVT